jgi:hypothetical protein
MPNAAVKPATLPTSHRSVKKPPDKPTSSGQYRIAAALVFTVFFGGFINLAPTGGLYPATVIIDGLCTIMFAGFILFAATQNRVRVDLWMLFYLLLLLVYVALFAHGIEPLYDKYLNLRNQVLYAFVAIFVATTIRHKDEVLRLLRLAMRLSVWLAAFGIFQFVFRDVLPEWLLVSKDTASFGYFGTDIVRSTGLIGNTIVFSNLLLLFFALHVARLASQFRMSDLIASMVLGVAIVVTFSRVAILGTVVIGVVILVLDAFMRDASKMMVRCFFTLIFGSAAACMAYIFGFFGDRLTESFVYRDLFMGGNASVQSSTDLHNTFIDMAFAALRKEPWIGLGIASQNQDSINAESALVITDGALWSLLVEGGLVLFAVYSFFLLACCAAAFKAWRTTTELKYAAAAFLVFSVYEFGAAAVYNSAFFGKAPFVMYWLVFGIVIALGRLSDEPPPLSLKRALGKYSRTLSLPEINTMTKRLKKK